MDNARLLTGGPAPPGSAWNPGQGALLVDAMSFFRPRFLLLLLLLAACGPPGKPPLPDIHAEPPRVHYVQNDNGRTLFFEQAIVNRADTALALYAFAYASDNVSQPPARAIYPPRALASMPRDRRFAIGDPAHGLSLTAAPGDTVLFRGALPMPTVWPDGQPIASRAFRDFSLYLYSEGGRNVYHQTWPLRRVGQ